MPIIMIVAFPSIVFTNFLLMLHAGHPVSAIGLMICSDISCKSIRQHAVPHTRIIYNIIHYRFTFFNSK